MAERILAALSEPLTAGGQPVAVEPSIGIVVEHARTDGPDELLRRADVAMYAAKAGGKGRWELYQPELEAAEADGAGLRAERVSWALRSDEQREQILSLLDRPDAVRTVFQPIIDLRTGELTAYEALQPLRGTGRPAAQHLVRAGAPLWPRLPPRGARVRAARCERRAVRRAHT